MKYTREQTAAWSQTDWNTLTGKTITLWTGQVEASRRTVKTVQLEAGPYGPDAMVCIDWEPEGGLAFVREGGAEITVHD